MSDKVTDGNTTFCEGKWTCIGCMTVPHGHAKFFLFQFWCGMMLILLKMNSQSDRRESLNNCAVYFVAILWPCNLVGRQAGEQEGRLTDIKTGRRTGRWGILCKQKLLIVDNHSTGENNSNRNYNYNHPNCNNGSLNSSCTIKHVQTTLTFKLLWPLLNVL